MHLQGIQILGGIWALAGAIGMIAFALFSFQRIIYENSWFDGISALTLGFGSAAILSLGVTLLGSPLAGLRTFQATTWVAVVFAVLLNFRIKRREVGPPGVPGPAFKTSARWIVGLGTVILVVQGCLSFLLSAMPSYVVALGLEPTSTSFANFLDVIRFAVWICTLALLAVGATSFLMLFVRNVTKGGAPKLETHWEGIGGGVGGWRMSPSLGYLLAAGILSLIFTVFVFRFESREGERPVAATPTPVPSPAPATAAR